MPGIEAAREAGFLARFGLAGLVNTAVGLAVILALDLGLGLPSSLANALGYAAGLGIAFLLHKGFVFRSARAHTGEYLAATALAFTVNQGVLALAAAVAPSTELGRIAAQVLAVGGYSVAQFLALRRWVFNVRGGFLADRWPELAAVAACASAFFMLRDIGLTHDAVWQLWIGRQLAGGAELYRDIVEINPPLWFWVGQAVHQLAAALGRPPAQVLIGAFCLAAALAVGLVGRLERDRSPAGRALVYAAILAAVIVAPLREFGQREHYALIASVPYVLLIAARCQGRRVGAGLALAIGAFAASGMALKHYFVLAPLMLEGLLLFIAGRAWRPWRAELLALGCGAVLYAAAVVVATPHFLQAIPPLVAAAYGGYDAPLSALLGQPAIALAAAVAAGLLLSDGVRTYQGKAALAAAAGFLVAYLLQRKGWAYQTVPAAGLLIMTAAIEGKAAWEAGRRVGPLLLGAAAAGVTLLGLTLGPYDNHKRGDAEAAMAGLLPGETVMVLSVNASAAWPMVEDRGLVWPSRHMTFWMLPAIAQAEAQGRMTPRLATVGRMARRTTLEDLTCRPPRRILIDTPAASPYLRGVAFDYLAFFRSDRELAAFLARYRTGTAHGRFKTLELADPTRLTEQRGCRTVF